jgi:TRAP-type C4-dicarboxylate transport system permease small subunit
MSFDAAAERVYRPFRKLVLAFAVLAGIAVFLMIGVTLVDVVLRIFRKGIPGAYDVVRSASLVAIVFSLPYVTAVKGHIAIEFFYHQFSGIGRKVMDTLFRVVSLVLFGLLVWRNIEYGRMLLTSGQVMPTINIPVFWMPWLTALCCAMMFLTILWHLAHPGKEMIKP